MMNTENNTIEVFRITYERDRLEYGEISLKREVQLFDRLRELGELITNSDTNYTLKTTISDPTEIAGLANKYLEPNCHFRIEGKNKASTTQSGSYLRAYN